jgi:hypothetical protein
MSDKKRKILILVEGERRDFQLMEDVLDLYGIGADHQIVSYKTDIYFLYKNMFQGGEDPGDFDLIQHLKEHEKDVAKKNLFDERYTDILLVFDFDPQSTMFSNDKIVEMMDFFVESSDMGKLYLNYPMVESFYHMKNIPDPDYNNYVATLDELNNAGYKERVNRENRNHDYSKFAKLREECDTVIWQNINKAWYLVDDGNMKKNLEVSLPDSADILAKQIQKSQTEKAVAVLCTCIFYIVDYNPKLLGSGIGYSI